MQNKILVILWFKELKNILFCNVIKAKKQKLVTNGGYYPHTIGLLYIQIEKYENI